MAVTSRGSDRTSTMSADSIATSVPAPTAMPTSAWVSAGASFTPSPVIATVSPRACTSLILVAFWSGRTSAKNSSRSSSRATQRATAEASREAQQPLLAPSAERNHVGHAEAALGERARLVEDDRVERSGALEGRAISDQEAVGRRQRRGHLDDQRHGEPQRMRARDDHDGHCALYGKGQTRAERKPGPERHGATPQSLARQPD